MTQDTNDVLPYPKLHYPIVPHYPTLSYDRVQAY